MKNRRLLCALVVVLLCGGFVFVQWQRLQDVSRRARDLRAKIAAEQSRDDGAKRAPVPRTGGAARPRPAAEGRLAELLRSAEKGPGGIPMVHPEHLFSDHPGFRSSYLNGVNAQRRLEYDLFFASAGLTQAQNEKFYALMAEFERAWADAPSDELRSTSYGSLEGEAVRAREAQIAEVLGAEAYKKLQDYRATMIARDALKTLAGLCYASAPLTLDQVDRMAAVATEQGIFVPSRAAKNPGAFDATWEAASKILSPAQLEAFELQLAALQIKAFRWQNQSYQSRGN
ncbi:MAG: hypothetical protein NTV51_11140 [Verrucomicrobia bacterium]|nr:hypothetical protein [Verrucomicrobiota bacterium]